MKDPEEVLDISNTAWEAEKERIEKKKKELPFGYDYILEWLDEISKLMTPQTLFNGGVALGRLIQIIIENKEEE